MAEEQLQRVYLKDDFYRDGFYKALVAFFILLSAIVLLIAVSLYLEFSKPDPVTFATGDEFRTLPLAPVNLPYLTEPDLIQWVSQAVPAVFNYDFVDYNRELDSASQYFTANGWKNFADILKIYADYTAINNSKLFVNMVPAGAPFILNQGVLPEGMYGWWLQMPVNLSYSSAIKGNQIPLMLQVLVVRISTANQLSGVAIEKMIVVKGGKNQAGGNNG